MVKALMIGFGSVGQALARMAIRHEERLRARGFALCPVGVFTRTKGSRVCAEGLDLRAMLDDVETGGVFRGDCTALTPLEACRTLDYDVLIELSPLSVAHAGEPALSHIRAALARGRNAVTANKGPVAFAYPELAALARDNGAQLRFESTVMDGAPVFNLVQRCMKGNRITGFAGILNSTTNYILCRMEEGASLQEAVEEAVAAGVAEADPSNDIDGWDAAVKVSVLARVLLGADIGPLQVARGGIREMTQEAIQAAAAEGKRWKLVCRGWRENGAAHAAVALEKLDAAHLFAGLSAYDSALSIESDMMAPNCIVQKGPSPMDTAFGVLEDLLSL